MEKLRSEHQLSKIVRKLMYQEKWDHLAAWSLNDNEQDGQVSTQILSSFDKGNQWLSISIQKDTNDVELELLVEKMLFPVGLNLFDEITMEDLWERRTQLNLNGLGSIVDALQQEREMRGQ